MRPGGSSPARGHLVTGSSFSRSQASDSAWATGYAYRLETSVTTRRKSTRATGRLLRSAQTIACAYAPTRPTAPARGPPASTRPLPGRARGNAARRSGDSLPARCPGPETEATLRQAFLARPQALAIIDEEAGGGTPTVSGDEKGAAERVFGEPLPHASGEAVDAAAQVCRLAGHPDVQAPAERDHDRVCQRLRAIATIHCLPLAPTRCAVRGCVGPRGSERRPVGRAAGRS